MSHLTINSLTKMYKVEKQICCFLTEYFSSNFRPQTCHLLTYTDFLCDFSRTKLLQVSAEAGLLKQSYQIPSKDSLTRNLYQLCHTISNKRCICDYRYQIYDEYLILCQQVFNTSFIHLLSQRDFRA